MIEAYMALGGFRIWGGDFTPVYYRKCGHFCRGPGMVLKFCCVCQPRKWRSTPCNICACDV